MEQGDQHRLARHWNEGVAVAAGRSLGAFAMHDGIVLAYQVVFAGLLFARSAPIAGTAASAVAALAIGCVVCRASALPARVRGVAYRLTLVGALLANYLLLRDALPAIRPDSLDGALRRADLALFSVEPALWLERWNRPLLVEWFSFFYLSYFGLVIIYVVAILFVVRPGRHTAEFAIGGAIVYCVGQLGYVAVPAYGPVRALAGELSGPLRGGLFCGLVDDAVVSFGAMKDVFPSVHAAASLWFTLFAARRAAHDRRFLWPALLTGFAAANILIATVFLRWHYAIDVLAGVALALVADAGSIRLSRLDAAHRARLGLPGAFCFADPADARRPDGAC